MSCSRCTKSFSIFNREYACPGCGFSVCSGCLKKSIPIKNKQQKVCSVCFSKHENPSLNHVHQPPPEALAKRMEKTPLPQMSSHLQNMRSSNLPTSTGNNSDITARLRALQADRSAAAPSEEQVRARLDKLRGQQSTAQAPGPVYQPPDTRPNIERSSDLLASVRAEVDLESRVPILTPEQEIERRLARLRGEQMTSASSGEEGARAKPDNTPDPQAFLLSTKADKTKDGYRDIENLDLDEVNRLMQEVNFKMKDEAKAALNDLEKDKVIQEQLARLKVKQNKEQPEKEDDESDEDSEEDTDNVLMQILAEARLEERLSPLPPESPTKDVRRGPGHGQPEPEPEELPWCVICNDDASVRCTDCGGDLYCGQCYKELHRDREERGHRTVGYRK